jgi:hypothetical protein
MTTWSLPPCSTLLGTVLNCVSVDEDEDDDPVPVLEVGVGVGRLVVELVLPDVLPLNVPAGEAVVASTGTSPERYGSPSG